MDKFFRVIGGRKFLLTVVSMGAAVAIDLMVDGGLSIPLASFLGAALSAFCASNWLNSREFHKADATKRQIPSKELSRIEKNVNKLMVLLDDNADTSYIDDTLTQINLTLGEVITSQANIMQTTSATNNTINAVIKSGG